MNQEDGVTQAAFDYLLAWLDADRERAGEKYEYIRRRLIKIFTCRGRHDAEELADETINRVTLKAPVVSKDYVGDPALYFYAVAQKVFLESLRKHPAAPPPPPAPDSDEVEQQHECLERCMERLSRDNRELVLEYYRNEKRAKIAPRKVISRVYSLSTNFFYGAFFAPF